MGGIDQASLELAGRMVGRVTGLHFPAARARDLRRGLTAAAEDFGFAESDAFVRWLAAATLSPAQIATLAAHLTVGETYFFRDRRAFDALERDVLPALIQANEQSGRRRLRLWSAACCTGEEAYSLAIAVRRSLPVVADWEVSLWASDINPRFLRRAARGVFGEWSFRNTPPDLRARYFTPAGDRLWELRPEIRRMVTFFSHNLAQGAGGAGMAVPEDVDVIFCRNALIYFDAASAVRVVRELADRLGEGGWLALGPNETSFASGAGLSGVSFSGAVFHPKTRPAADVDTTRPLPPELDEGWIPAEARPPDPDGAWLDEPETAADCQPGPAEQLRQARALADEGRLAEALAQCDRTLTIDKMEPAGHYLRGVILKELGDLAAAAGAFRRAIYLVPEFLLAHFALGNLARREGRRAEAARHFENALALARRHAADDPLPEAEGLTAGRLAELIAALHAPANPDPVSRSFSETA